MSIPSPIVLYNLSDATMKGLLPAGYTPLAYIENTGSSYIDTGWKYTDGNVAIDAEYTIPSNNDATVFGSSNDNTKWCLLIYRYSNSSGHYCGTISGNWGSTLPAGAKRHILYEISGTTASMKDGYSTNSGSCGTIPSQSYNYTLFCHNYGGSKMQYAHCRIYYLRIIHKGSLVVDLRPAKRDSDGAIGMYDLVSRTFKTNSGSGSFIAGPPLAVGKGGGKSLPEEYLLVEYLESTGTQYISTSYSPSSNVTIKSECSLAITKNLSDNAIWGSYNTSSGVRSYPICIYNNKPFYGNSTGNIGLNSGSVSQLTIGTFYTLCTTSGPSSSNMLVNGNLILSSSASASIVNNCRYAIFGRYHSTNMSDGSVLYISSIKLQWLKHYEDNVIKFSFIPCYRKSDMKPGMYDTVNGVFYTNAGSGEFILGPTVCPYYSWEPNAQGGSFDYFKSLDVGGRTTLINGGKGFTATFTSNDTYNFMNMHPLIPGYKFTFSCDVSGLPSGGYWYFNLWNDENTHPWKLQNGHNKLTTLITTDRIKNYNTNNYTQLNRMLWNDGSRSTPDNSSTIRVENVKIYQGIYDTPKYAYFHNVSTTYDSRFGWVADFNGSAIEMPSLLTLLNGSTSFSFSIWFKRNSGSGWQTIWGCNGFELEAARSGSFNVVAYNWGQSSSGGITYSSGEWHHLVMTRNTTETKFYLDGVLGYTGTAHTIPNTPLYLGAWANPKSLNFTGQMANMMLFDTVLTADLVKELYGK